MQAASAAVADARGAADGMTATIAFSAVSVGSVSTTRTENPSLDGVSVVA